MNKHNVFGLLIGLVILGLLSIGAVGNVSASIPVLRFVSPQDGDTVSGAVKVQVFSPTDFRTNVNILPQKELILDVGELPGIKMFAQDENLYAAKWDTTSVPNGRYVLTAKEITWTLPPEIETVTVEVRVQND